MRTPGPRGYEIYAVIRDIWRDPLRCFVNLSHRYGDVVYAHLGRHWLLITHPDHIRHVLHDRHRNFRKGPNFGPFRPLMGEGLLISDGEDWLHQRRLVQPAFHHKRIEAMAATIADCTASMLARWQLLPERAASLDIEAEMHRLVMHMIGSVLFSINLRDQADAIAHAHMVCIEHITRRIQRFGFPPESWPTASNRRFKQSLQTLDAVVQDMITERRRSGVDTGDLLSMLVLARDEMTGQGMTDRRLRDELINILTAGFETTANGLCWLWYLLSTHPLITQRLHAEVASVLNGQMPTAQDLPRLSYTRTVIEETLRLYPPVWLTSRTALEKDEIGGYPIAAGAILMLSPYLTHRHPAFWEDAEDFEPKRFSSDCLATRHRYAYIPFGGGPHLCIGHALAMMMMQIIVAMVAQTVRLDLVPGHPVVPQPLITLRPKYGLLMTVRKRRVL